MELVELKCKECGAILKINKELKKSIMQLLWNRIFS